MSNLPRESPQSGSPEGKLDVQMDEARIEKVTTIHDQYEIDPVLEKRVDRKIDMHILPWLFGIW